MIKFHMFSVRVLHCTNNNLNLCTKTKPVPDEADATVYVWFLSQIQYRYKLYIVHKSRADTVASLLSVTGLAFMQIFRFFWGQWTVS